MNGLDFLGYIVGGLLLLAGAAFVGMVLWVAFSGTMKRHRAEMERMQREFEENHARITSEIERGARPKR